MKKILLSSLYILFFFNIAFSNTIENNSLGDKNINSSSPSTVSLLDNFNINNLPWTFINTGLNQTMFVPNNTSFISYDNGHSIEHGDYLGVFYDDNGTLACGGYSIWDTTYTNWPYASVAAMGVNSPLPGFALGEAINWKIYRASDGAVFDLYATYDYSIAILNSGGFYTGPNAMSVVETLTDIAPPTVTSTGLSATYCENGVSSALSGSPTGGVFSGAGVVGDSFSPIMAGAGTHSITYTYTGTNGISYTDIQSTTVIANPIIDLGIDKQLCEPFSYSIDAGQFSSYTWNTGAITQTIQVMAVGDYSVTVTDGNSCSNSDTIEITAAQPVVVSFSGLASSYCNDASIVTLTGTPSGGSFNGLGVTGNTFNPSAVPPGNYNITYSYFNINTYCSGATINSTIVYDSPLINLGSDQSICIDGSITIDAGVYDTYLWSDGSVNQTIDVLATGVYSVTVSDNGCVNSDTISIDLFPVPSIDLGTDQSMCSDGSLVLDAGVYNAYLWSDASVLQTLEVAVSGIYSLTIQDANGCENSDTIFINLFPIPQSNLDTLYLIVPGQTIQLDAGADMVSYNWNTGSTDQFISTSYPDTFYIAYSDTNGCSNNDTTYVEFDLDVVHDLYIPQGWSYFSTYVDPYFPSIDTLVLSIINSVIMVKNDDGLVYWPAFNLNMIGDYIVGEGYQIKLLAAEVLPITGLMVVPEWTQINLAFGWNLIGYLRNTPGDLETMIAPINSEIIIIKNGFGQFYWPGWGINMIGDMEPGGGYLVSMLQAASFSYPWNGALSKSLHITNPETTNYIVQETSGFNMTVGIPLSAWNEVPEYGDEIAVINSENKVIGSAVFANSNVGITVWGDDPYSDEIENISINDYFKFRLWKRSTGKEIEFNITNWQEGNDRYNTNAISVAKKVVVPELAVSLDVNVFPNPFKKATTITYTVPEDGDIKISIINILGKTVEIPFVGYKKSGQYSFEFDASSLASGYYFCEIITSKDKVAKQLVKE